MESLFVHVRMKNCCRRTLKEIDERKNEVQNRQGVFAAPSLFGSFSNMPIDQALAALPAGDMLAERSALETVVLQICQRLCDRHAVEHQSKGELTEGKLWTRLSQFLASDIRKSDERYAFVTLGVGDLILFGDDAIVPRTLPDVPTDAPFTPEFPKTPEVPQAPKNVRPPTEGGGGSETGKNPNRNPYDGWEEWQQYRRLLDKA